MPVVKEYSIALMARRTTEIPVRGQIRIEGEDKRLALLRFLDDDVPTGKIKVLKEHSWIFDMPMSAWLPTIDLLRNEKHIILQIVDGEAQLVSATVPIGRDAG